MKTFEDIYKDRPDKAEVGSSGYSNMKNLYDICDRLRPELIVESGHWKSNSAYLFHHFCRVVSYDIQFDTALYEHESIRRNLGDIERNPIATATRLKFQNILFFFDDHISHLQRLEWLIKIGAKYAVFDDNQPEAIANTLKNPPAPTLQMLMDWDDPQAPMDNRCLDHIKKYEVMPFHGDRRNFDTRLTYIEL